MVLTSAWLAQYPMVLTSTWLDGQPVDIIYTGTCLTELANYPHLNVIGCLNNFSQLNGQWLSTLHAWPDS
jgi:hypothetical protein